MATPSTPNLNRTIFLLAVPALILMIFLGGLVIGRWTTPAAASDPNAEAFTKMAELLPQLEKTLQNPPSGSPLATLPTEMRKQFRADLETALEAQKKENERIRRELEAARARADADLIRRLEEQQAQHQQRVQDMQTTMERLAADLQNGQAGAVMPSNIDPARPERLASEMPEIGKVACRVGLMVLCVYYPGAAPFLVAIAAEIGLFDNEPELRDVYLRTVSQVARGESVNPPDVTRLTDANRDGTLPEALARPLAGLIRSRQGQPGGSELLNQFQSYLDMFPATKPPLVSALELALAQPGVTAAQLRAKFPHEGGEPVYESQALRTQVDRLFTGEARTRFWDGPGGLGSIRIR